jgi:Tfp pilus assembly protein PilO
MSLWRRIVSERRIIVIPLLTALAINLIVIAAVVVPLSRSVVGDESRAQDVKLALASANRMARVANDTKVSQSQADVELKKFYAEVLPTTLGDARALLYVELAKLASEAGVQHQSGVFEQEEVEDSHLVRYHTDVALTGEYAGIRRFLYHLETSERFFVVESVKLGQSGQRQGSTGSLEVVLRVATYYSRPAIGGGGQ